MSACQVEKRGGHMFKRVFIELESNFLASRTKSFDHASVLSTDHHWNTQMEYLRSIWEIACAI